MQGFSTLAAEVWAEVWARVSPATAGALGEGSGATGVLLIAAVAVAAVVVTVPPLWRVVRLAVTLVHELGHAVVGMFVGRRFTGFVLRSDMSGHAVTAGPARGFGRAATTWAGYPAPAAVGAAAAWLAGHGWAAPAVTVGLAVLLVALIRVRSALTALVTLLAIAAAAALWWWRDDALQAAVLLGLACVLVVGAWRHLGAVWRRGGAASDPAVLAGLTRVPVAVWNLSFALVCAAATWVVGTHVWLLFAPVLPGG